MRARSGWLALAGIACWLHLPVTAAAPYRPADDALVLLALPASKTIPDAPPEDPELAAQEAQRFIELARSTDDPRYLGYAEGRLQRWMTAPAPPQSVLLMRATLRQARHDFDGAVADLDRLLAKEPTNAQAWLTRATVLRVQGRFAEAAKSCEGLAKANPSFVAILCRESVRGCRGELASSAKALEAMIPASRRAPRAIRTWFAAERAEQSLRLGRASEGLRIYSSALAEGLGDTLLRADLADLLLELGRPADVFAIVGQNPGNELLALRAAIASRRLGKPRPELEAALADFHAAARRRGESGHAREEARYELEIRGDAARAVALARENWRHQREPSDARLLLEAARKSNSSDDIAAVRDWLKQTGFEDARLQPLLAEAGP